MPWFLPTTHPSASFRNPNLLGPLTAHVENFVWITKNGPPPRPRLERNPPLARLKKFLRICFQRRLPVSIDVETGRWGHIARFAELRIIGVGADIGPGWGLSWDWRTIPFEVKRLLKRTVAHNKVAKLWVNGVSYDFTVLKRYGFKINGPQYDIKDGRRAVSSTSRVGLGPQAALYLPGIRAWKAEVLEDEDDVKGFVSIGSEVKDKELDYNAEDCVRPAQIWRKQKVELRAGGERTALIYQQLRRLAVVGAEMQYHGFHYDRGEAKKLQKECEEISARETRELRKLINKRAPGFRVGKGGVSEVDLRSLLFKDCKVKGINGFNLEVPMDDKCWTETGLPSVDRTALLYLYAMPDTPQEVREIMRVCWKIDAPLKVVSTYITSKKVQDAIGPDGAVHASCNPGAAETGRWTCRDPNLYNLSEELKDEDADLRGVLPNARRLYRAPPGYVIVHRDFSALEGEVMAEYTGDVALRAMLDVKAIPGALCKRTGKPLKADVHTNRARLWFGIPEDENAPTQVRKQGKVVGFQCLPSGTPIATRNGSKPIEKMQPGDWTWSWWQGKYVATRVKRLIDNGRAPTLTLQLRDKAQRRKTLTLTGNHRLLLRDGSYRRADELKVGDRLMPFVRHYNKAGYAVLNPYNDARREYEHRWLLPGFEMVHHRKTKGDNRPENIVGMTRKEHAKEHPIVVTKESRAAQSRSMSARWKKNGKRWSEELTAKRNASSKYQKWIASAEAHAALKRGRIKRWNHVVEAITVNAEKVRVWDLEIDHPAHNFAIDKCVFVHNSQYAAGCEGVYMKVLEKMQEITFEEVHALWTTFRKVHTGIVDHWDTSLRFALEHGYSEAPIMHWRRAYPDLRAVKDTETSNYAIQGGAAAIANSTLVGIRPEDYPRSMHARLHKEFPDAFFLCHVYDSYDVACRPRDAEGVSQLMDECMKGPWRIGSRLKKYASEGKIGQRWSEV